jgi:hypothetical protein
VRALFLDDVTDAAHARAQADGESATRVGRTC